MVVVPTIASCDHRRYGTALVLLCGINEQRTVELPDMEDVSSTGSQVNKVSLVSCMEEAVTDLMLALTSRRSQRLVLTLQLAARRPPMRTRRSS